tara:strand:- start:234 stop:1253 length:1020 start_codon:yes stop_codon:yes gene_type:complete
MYNLDSADALVKKIISGEYSPLPNNPGPFDPSAKNLYSAEYDNTVSDSFINEKLSVENLTQLKIKIGDVEFARQAKKNSSRFKYNKDIPELNELISHMSEKDKCTYRPSGLYFCPPKGFCGWHTNSTAPGDRIYLVWAEEDNKSFFRWEDPRTGEIITKWEKKGWNINRFVAPVWHCLGSWTNRISIGIAYPIKTGHDELRGFHSCKQDGNFGDWSITDSDIDEGINMVHLRPHLNDNRLKSINHSEICWKGEDNKELKRNGSRYSRCDISFPPIVIRDAKNHKNRKYRLIDGAHRMTKMFDKGIKESKFYVFEMNEIEKYIIPLDFGKDVTLIRNKKI